MLGPSPAQKKKKKRFHEPGCVVIKKKERDLDLGGDRCEHLSCLVPGGVIECWQAEDRCMS